MSWEGVRCQLCALQLVARTPSGSGPHPAGSPAKSHRFPSREARGDLLWAGPPPEGLRWPCSVDGPGTCSLQRSSRREPALHVGSGQSEFFTHGHKSALRRQRRGWEGPVSPLLTLSSRGGHRTWSFCPRTLSGSPQALSSRSWRQPRRRGMSHGLLSSGRTWICLAPPCSSDLHTTPTEGAPAPADRASGPTRRQESPEPRRPSQRRAQGDRPHAFYGRTVEAAPPP